MRNSFHQTRSALARANGNMITLVDGFDQWGYDNNGITRDGFDVHGQDSAGNLQLDMQLMAEHVKLRQAAQQCHLFTAMQVESMITAIRDRMMDIFELELEDITPTQMDVGEDIDELIELFEERGVLDAPAMERINEESTRNKEIIEAHMHELSEEYACEGVDDFDNVDDDVEDYDAAGYNNVDDDVEDYDAAGYDAADYDAAGYDINGYDINGYDVAGLGYDGYDAEGFDAAGVNASGIDVDGYDEDGFDANGYDVAGFDHNGVDVNGINPIGDVVFAPLDRLAHESG